MFLSIFYHILREDLKFPILVVDMSLFAVLSVFAFCILKICFQMQKKFRIIISS